MMREAQRRGHTVAVCLPQDLVWQRGSQVTARVQDIVLTGDATNWFQAQPLRSAALTWRSMPC
jgi:glutathione synthase